MKASSKLIKFYKGVLLEQIHTKLVNDGNILSVTEVDELLKAHADSIGSTTQMSMEELQNLCEWSIVFGSNIGLSLDYPSDHLDSLIDMKLGE